MIRSKTCITCGECKSLSEFYIHKQMADGRLNKCKSCCREHSRENRRKKADFYREYDRKRGKRKKSRRTNEQVKANNAVSRAIKAGKLIRPDGCERCGATPVQAHHDDHARCLDVMWLCPVCHANRHAELGRLGRGAKRMPDAGPYPSKPGGRTLDEAQRLSPF